MILIWFLLTGETLELLRKYQWWYYHKRLLPPYNSSNNVVVEGIISYKEVNDVYK